MKNIPEATPHRPNLAADGAQQAVLEALTEIIFLCDPPADKLDRVNDLACMILAQIDLLRDES